MAKFIPMLLLLMFCCLEQIVGMPFDLTKSIIISSTLPTKQLDIESTNPPIIPTTPRIYQMYVTSNVANRFARTTVLSRVKNTAPKSQEATFSIVLPDTAFISGFSMEINGKNYTASVKERERARKIYDDAVASGQGAAHVSVSARDSNCFTVSVNIEPVSKAAFYLIYEELLKRQEGHYELIINLHPGLPVKDLSVEVKIRESRKIVNLKVPPLRSGNEIAEDKAELDPGANVKIIDDKNAVVIFSPNLKRQKQLAAKLGSSENKGLAGQFVIRYDVERDPTGGEVLIQDGFFVHFFAPSELTPLPKHVVFILDTSASMYGQKIVQLRQAMLNILGQLNEQDQFNLVEFNSNVKVWNLFENEKSVWFPARSNNYSWTSGNNNDDTDITNVIFPDAYQVNANTIRKAKEAAASLFPVGATDIYTALRVGLYLIELSKRKETNHQPMIIFLTDGDPTVRVTSTETILTKITEYNSGPRKSVLFTLSFGNDADKNFLKKVALRNFGFSRHIYEAADASLQLQNFYKQISSPLLTNVTFKYERSFTSLTKTDFPIHFGGSEIVIAGFCGTLDLIPPTVDGWSDRGWLSFKPRVVHSITNTERLWAYLFVKQLLEQKESTDKVQEELQRKALELSLKYEFVTSVSSLVVVKPNSTENLQPEATDKSDFEKYDIDTVLQYRVATAGKNGALSPRSEAAVHKVSDVYHKGEDNANTILGAPTTTSLAIVSTSSVSTTKELKPNIFTSIPWLKSILRDGILSLANGNFKLGLDETINDDIACPKTPYNETGRCALLSECKEVYFLLTSKDVFENHFCILKIEYAGVCCPDLP